MFVLLFMQLTIFRCVCSISTKPILIIVSYDGFRYNYFDKEITPHMLKLRQESSYVEYMYNVFPTKTFPNHFTLVTGLYTETHGVMGNQFYDPITKDEISISSGNMFTQNKDIIPIWTLNELAGDERYSGVMMWPGGAFKYQNITSTYFQKWSHDSDMFKRVDTVIEWLTDPYKPANLICLYVEEPDYYSHIYGPDSKKVMDRLKLLDKLAKYLDNQLQLHHLRDKATVVQLSDHGMAGVKYKDMISLNKILAPNTYQFCDTSPALHLLPKEGFEESVYSSLKQASEDSHTFDVYKKDELPAHWHFRNNARAPPILLLAKVGYGFREDLIKMFDTYQKEENVTVTENMEVGVHGYDPDEMSMHAFFMIRGPHVKKNNVIKPFVNIELYRLFASVLEIEPSPNNGTLHLDEDVLIPPDTTFQTVLLLGVGGVVLSLALISCAAAITILIIKRQQNMTTAAALNKRFPQSFQQSIEAQHLLETEEA